MLCLDEPHLNLTVGRRRGLSALKELSWIHGQAHPSCWGSLVYSRMKAPGLPAACDDGNAPKVYYIRHSSPFRLWLESV